MLLNKGTFSKDTQESNSLAVNAMKYPEIGRKMLQAFPQYGLQANVDGFDKFAKEQIIGSNKFEFFVRGRLNHPVTLTGGGSTSGGSNQAILTLEAKEDTLNPGDTIMIGGKEARVQSSAQPSSGGFTYSYQFVNRDNVLAPSDIVAGNTVGKIATAFEEGSERGYESHMYPDKYANWLTTTRKACSITGDAATDIIWFESGGQRLWMFQDAVDQMKEFMYEKEKSSWYGQRSVDANGMSGIIGETGRQVIKGDGLLAQIDGSNMDSYSGALTEPQITRFLGHLRMNTGYNGSHYMVYTGMGGFEAFDRAMKDFVVPNGSSGAKYDVEGQRVSIGFKTFSALGMTITVYHNPIFDDPNLHPDIDPATGYPKESFRMVFLNWGSHDGINNIERKVKGAGGVNRSMVIKQRLGMADVPTDKNSSGYIATTRDAHSVEFLDQSGIILRNPLSCGVWVKI